MTYRCLLAALVSGVLLFSLAACDDSSTVGLGVGPDTLAGGQPETINVFPDTFGIESKPEGPPFTSNVQQSPTNGHRILAGTVTDPIVGSITTRGHIDFARAAGLDSVASIVSVDLILEAEYRYGSTTDQQTISVHDATDEIQDSLRANSTALGVGAQITSGSFVSEDTLVTIPLPREWIDANRSELLNNSDDDQDGFDARFQGLVLAPSSGNHVMGFNRRSSRLRMIAENATGDRDTLSYFGSKSFTYIERSGSPSIPPQTELLVDGTGEELIVDVDFNGPPFDSIGIVPINRAEFFIAVDSTALASTEPSNFTRPDISPLLLDARLADNLTEPNQFFRGQNVLCGRLGVRTIGTTSCGLVIEQTENGFLATPSVFRQIVELSLNNEDPLFKDYTLSFSSNKPTITPILLRRPDTSSPIGSSRLQLTYVPQR